jgi:tryptophan synthase alpha chain
MKRLQQAFSGPGPRLIPFVMAGDPDLATTVELIRLLEEEGVAAIEVGVPFSDPLADGPVIQAAAERALERGVTLADVLRLGRNLRHQGCRVPLILFSYANPLYQHGFGRLAREAADAGFDGLIVPDLPLEESEPLRTECDRAGLALIPLAAPTSGERIARIAGSARGFVYCVSSLGTTGMRERFADSLPAFLSSVRRVSPVPVAVGFGVSTPEQVRLLSDHADGVVVGSALVKTVADRAALFTSPERRTSALQEIRAFVRRLKSR